jgi:tripartite-type tricarboxylate transporter receptor subunit TctC
MHTLISRKKFLAASLLACLAPRGFAQPGYPNKPIRVVLPVAPGSTTDAAARLICQKISASLGQPVVIDNRPGASGVIGTSAGLRSAPDGYTLTIVTSTSTVAAVHLVKQMPYALSEMVPIASFFSLPSVFVVSKSFPATTFKQFLEIAKAKPGALSMAYSNATAVAAAASLKQVAGIDFVTVSYKAPQQAVTDVIGGQLPLMINDIGSVLPHIQSGALRALAITADKRTATLPDVPTMSELLPERLEFYGWTAFVAPAGTPQAIVTRLSGIINGLLQGEEVTSFLQKMGADPMVHSPTQLGEFIKSEEGRWGRAFKAAGVQPE